MIEVNKKLKLFDESQDLKEFDSTEVNDEDRRLGGRKALSTLVVLSIGPLISQIAGALYGIINTIWISKAIGDTGLAAISTYQIFDTIGRSFAYFLQVSASAMISSLYGSGTSAEGNQVFSDLIRVALICGVLVPSICLPCAIKCVKWFGADDEIANLGFKFILPNLCLTIVPCTFMMVCGCLQGEGRSWLLSISQVVALVLDMCVFCPLFLLGIKTGIAGAAFATGISEFIPCAAILFMFYKGKFGIRPQFKELFRKFSPHTFNALKIVLHSLYSK